MYSHQGPWRQRRPYVKPTFPHGSEPLLSTNRLHDMRARLDDVPLSPNARQAAEAGIARIEQHWAQRKNDQYAASIAKRDEQHATVVQVAKDGREKAKSILDKVRNGRMSAKEARVWVRNVLGEHADLVAMHDAISDSESSLEVMEAMDVADFQADQMDRFPSDRQASPNLGKEVENYISGQMMKAYRDDVVPGGVDARMLVHPDGPQDA